MVKTNYQLPDNLSFTGQHVHTRRSGVAVCRLGACEVYLVTYQGNQSPSSAPHQVVSQGVSRDVNQGGQDAQEASAARGAATSLDLSFDAASLDNADGGLDEGITTESTATASAPGRAEAAAEAIAQAGTMTPTLAPCYGLHSKLWTRKFPHAHNVLKRIQGHLMPVFRRLEADAVLKSLLERCETLHAREMSQAGLTTAGIGLSKIGTEAAAVAATVEELEEAVARYAAYASVPVAEWARRSLSALHKLQMVLETTSNRCLSRRFDYVGVDD